jgi:hypothetical protein
MISSFKSISVLLMALIVSSVVIALLWSRLSKVSTERDQAIEFSRSTNDSLITYVNKFGQEVAKTEVLQLSVDNARKLIEDERLSVVKYFNGINKRLNNLEQITTTEVEYSKEIDVPILPPADSAQKAAGIRTFVFTDSLNSVYGWIRSDSIKVNMHADVPIYSVVYWQRRKNKWLLGLRCGAGKDWFDETMSTNPSVTIKKRSNIQVKRKPK